MRVGRHGVRPHDRPLADDDVGQDAPDVDPGPAPDARRPPKDRAPLDNGVGLQGHARIQAGAVAHSGPREAAGADEAAMHRVFDLRELVAIVIPASTSAPSETVPMRSLALLANATMSVR